MSHQPGDFVPNSAGIFAMMQSQPCQEIARREAEKRGEITDEYIGTQRVWVRVKENDRDKD